MLPIAIKKNKRFKSEESKVSLYNNFWVTQTNTP